MKNVFIINSHTTFLSAIGTINYLNLLADSIILLYMRNYKNDVIVHNFKVVRVTDFFNSIQDLFKSKSIREKELERIDWFVNENIGDKYRLFCPHLQNGIWQAIYTHPLCVEMSYIQEGGIPYSTAYIVHPSLRKKIYLVLVNKIYRRSERIWRGGWYTYGTMNKQKEIHSFAINKLFFKNLPSINHIIKWPAADMGITISSPSMIFVFDGFVQNGIIEREFYMKKCEELVDLCATDYNYLKFHPNQTEKDKAEIASFFSSRQLTFQFLPDAVPFEMILSSHNNLHIAGFGSSLLYFAYDLGHQVICKDSWLLTSAKFADARKRNGFMSIEECKKELERQ